MKQSAKTLILAGSLLSLAACVEETGSSVTVNALRLHHETDLGSGEAVYGMNAVYVVVNARETPLQVAQVSGTGSLICEKPLPQSLTSNAE